MKDYPALAQVPNCTIKGSRAPFLQANDAYFTTLQNLGIQYDTSMTFSNSTEKKAYWPFTLDFGVPDSRMCTTFGSCPTKAFPGLWEFPVTEFDYANVDNCMDPLYDDYDAYLLLLKQNFLDSYNTTKVPRGFSWHWRYFSSDNNFGLVNTTISPINATRVKLFTDFYTWLVTNFTDIIFATERQVIEWMKNPVDYETTKTMSMFTTCPNLTLTPRNTCVNGQVDCLYPALDSITVCGTQCPSIYPQKGAEWTFPDGYTNYLGECITFDGIAVGTGAYIDVETNTTCNDSSSNTSNTSESNASLNTTSTNTSNVSSNSTCTNASSNTSLSNTSNVSLNSTSTNASANTSSSNTSHISLNSTCTNASSNTSSSNVSSNDSSSTSNGSPFGGTNELPLRGIVSVQLYERRRSLSNKETDDACFSFNLKNLDSKRIAKAFIISSDACPKLLKINNIWGYTETYKSTQNFLLKGTGTSIPPGKTVKNIGGWCVVDSSMYDDDKIEFIFGVDLYEETPKNALKDCKLFCGNGMCDAGETSINCPIDCNKLVCRTRRF